MTCREKLKIEYPDYVDEGYQGGCLGCPSRYGYLMDPPYCITNSINSDICAKCWDREIPEEKKLGYAKSVDISRDDATKSTNILDYGSAYGGCFGCPDIGDEYNCTKCWDQEIPHILDSGNRREFDTGAVRDIQEGKGRCDLMPLDVVGRYLEDEILEDIAAFQKTCSVDRLYIALWKFAPHWGSKEHMNISNSTMLLETSIHYEDGAKKYGENNWQKGIPVHCYIDSAVRHYLKFIRGDMDEPHDRAFVWNILGAIWTCINKPDLNDYASKEN